MPEKLFTIREAAHYLDVTEKEVITLAEEGKIPAYKVGGVYLRFKRDQLDKAKHIVSQRFGTTKLAPKATVIEKIRDFFYFNDFYILSAIVIAVIIFVIVNG